MVSEMLVCVCEGRVRELCPRYVQVAGTALFLNELLSPLPPFLCNTILVNFCTFILLFSSLFSYTTLISNTSAIACVGCIEQRIYTAVTKGNIYRQGEKDTAYISIHAHTYTDTHTCVFNIYIALYLFLKKYIISLFSLLQL